MTTGEKIKNRREFIGLSVEEVAERIGVSRATLYRYESDSAGRMKADVLIPLSKVLRTTPAELLGWDDASPTVTDDVVSFPVLGDVAAGYDRLAVMDDVEIGEKIDIPRSYLHGRPASDYFVLKVRGDSMWPMYLDGDKVLVLHQSTMNRSGEIGVVVYGDEAATLKKIEYTMGEDWMRLVPLNLNKYQPELIEGERLEHCRVLGIPRMVIREIVD